MKLNWKYDEYEQQQEFVKNEYEHYKVCEQETLQENGIETLEQFEAWILRQYPNAWYEQFCDDEGNIFANAEINKGIVFGIKDKQALKDEMKDFYGDWIAFNKHYPFITDFRELVKHYGEKTRNDFKISLDYDEATGLFEMKSVIYNGSFMTLDNTTTLTEQEYNDLWDEAQAEMEQA